MVEKIVSESEKRIYNAYLIATRLKNGKPVKLRKNFDNMKEEHVVVLHRLDSFFKNYPHINLDSFFEAPYKVYPDSDYYNLDYYISANAKKTYTLYMKSIETEDPDTPESLKRLIESLNFICKYCKQQNISLLEYNNYCEGTVPVFVDHLKNHKINYYTLHALTFNKINVESEILEFSFSNFFSTFQKTKNKFYVSKKMRELAKQAINKITTILK